MIAVQHALGCVCVVFQEDLVINGEGEGQVEVCADIRRLVKGGQNGLDIGTKSERTLDD